MRLLLQISFIALTFLPSVSKALEEGAAVISKSHKVYYRYKKAEKDKPTVVLLNGWIFASKNWDSYIHEMSKKGFGILQVIYSTQPESIRLLSDNEAPYFRRKKKTLFGQKLIGLEVKSLVDEIMFVIDQKKIKNFSLVGFSYGAFVASEIATQYTNRIDKYIALAPAIIPTGRFSSFGASRYSFYRAQKSLGSVGLDFSYDLEIEQGLATAISPMQYSYPGIDFDDFFFGLYQMTRAIKWLDVRKYIDKKLPPTYLFLASLDDPIQLRLQKDFWKRMDKNPSKRGLVTFEGGYHKLPEFNPKKVAHTTALVLNGNMREESITIKIGSDKPSKIKRP